jgi:hypothetical protein
MKILRYIDTALAGNEILSKCNNSVVAYADFIGAELVTIEVSSVNNPNIRIETDLMRIQYLSENPYTLYLDHDIEILSNDLILDDRRIYTGIPTDCIMYNGETPQYFKIIYDLMINSQSTNRSEGRIARFIPPAVNQMLRASAYTHHFFTKSKTVTK